MGSVGSPQAKFEVGMWTYDKVEKKREPVDRRHAVEASCGGRALVLAERKILDGLGGQKKSYGNRRFVGQSYGPRKVTAPSPRGLSTEPTRTPYDFRAESAETARKLHRHRTISVRFLHRLRMLHPTCPKCPYKKSQDAHTQCKCIRRTLCSHIRCLKNRTESGSIYRTAPGANVNYRKHYSAQPLQLLSQGRVQKYSVFYPGIKPPGFSI